MAGHLSINALLSADQVELVQQYMKESSARFFSDGVREYVGQASFLSITQD